jgi:hypothetical protein
LVPVTARWTDPKIRKTALSPYARDAEAKTLSLLDESLLREHEHAVGETVKVQLQTSAPRDIQELLPYLQRRGEEYARDAVQRLRQRGEAEARAMREILETQRKHIESTASKHEKMDTAQLRLDFGDDEDELRQLEANRRYWNKRLELLKEELESEPGRIRDLYEVKATRIEPVGLVYLWPVTG